jgi:hypothetical protein
LANITIVNITTTTIIIFHTQLMKFIPHQLVVYL